MFCHLMIGMNRIRRLALAYVAIRLSIFSWTDNIIFIALLEPIRLK